MPGADGQPIWVGVNTALPNRLVRATIEAGCLEPWLGPIETIRAEVTYGAERRSRIDLLLTPAEGAADPRPIYVEVKNTTWSEGDLALFPDTVTERGQKHLLELIGVLPEARAVLLPCLSRGDVRRFAPGDRPIPVMANSSVRRWRRGWKCCPAAMPSRPMVWPGAAWRRWRSGSRIPEDRPLWMVMGASVFCSLMAGVYG